MNIYIMFSESQLVILVVLLVLFIIAAFILFYFFITRRHKTNILSEHMEPTGRRDSLPSYLHEINGKLYDEVNLQDGSVEYVEVNDKIPPKPKVNYFINAKTKR